MGQYQNSVAAVRTRAFMERCSFHVGRNEVKITSCQSSGNVVSWKTCNNTSYVVVNWQDCESPVFWFVEFHVNNMMWSALSESRSYLSIRNQINTARFLPSTLSLCAIMVARLVYFIVLYLHMYWKAQTIENRHREKRTNRKYKCRTAAAFSLF